MRANVPDWKTYGQWAGRITLLFAPMYPLCNWISTQRTDTLGLYWPWELALPLVPEMIWVYFSMYILFFLPPFLLGTSQLVALGQRLFWGTAIAGLAYLVVPTKLGFARTLPTEPLYATVYQRLFSVDEPHNMAPSLHIVFTTLLAVSFATAATTLPRKAFWYGWLLLIAISTILVHQHHVLDVVTGFVVALGLVRWHAEPTAQACPKSGESADA